MSDAAASPVDELARYTSTLEFADLPPEAVRLVERCFVDTVGVTVAGAVERAGLLAAETFDALGSRDRGPATVAGHDWQGTATEAAFANATAGHGLDFDDVGEPMSNHPSVTMVAPLLAVGEQVGASGRDLVAGFVAGFETQYYLAAPIMPTHYEAGWHSTATLGTFGATAAVANLLGLPVDPTRHALNVAASFPAGLKRNFGSDTKPMHAGAAARSGVTAALLAAEGVTADADAFRGERGFFDLYTRPEGYDLAALPDLGAELGLVTGGIHVKKYPCCYFTHTSITAARRLREEGGIEPADVESVTVAASQGAHDALAHEDPDTGLQAKFSMDYSVAAALARDSVDLAAYDDETVGDPTVQAVRERVTFELDSDLPYASHEAEVTIRTTAGETHALRVSDPPGTADDPLSDAELREKFVMCATRGWDVERASALYEVCDSLRDCEDVHELTELL
jgi:2-methylcitrate dehydratase PrpD